MFDWEGPSNAPDLALYALLKLNSAAVAKLSDEALRRRVARYRESLIENGALARNGAHDDPVHNSREI